MNDIGRYIWFDLMTSDTVAASNFYKETIGWNTLPWEEGDKPYTMFTVSEKPMGGLMELAEETKAMGIPPHWIAYAKVEDVDASLLLVKELGGKVWRDGLDIPKVGRIAVVADPQGAVFALFSPEEERDLGNTKGSIGQMSWCDLNTTDYEKAWIFYSALLGWEESEIMDMGPNGKYFMFRWKDGEHIMGGMSNMAATTNTPPHWLHYTNVTNIEDVVSRIGSHGGKVIKGPMKVPGGSQIAVCLDPQGAAFAVHEPIG